MKTHKGLARALCWLAAFLFLASATRAAEPKGFVAAWGDNYLNDLDVPADATNIVAVSSGNGFNLAVRDDGTMIYWGAYGATGMAPPPGIFDVKAVDVGGTVQLALRKDGSVVAWGFNHLGQTNVPGDLAKVVAVRAGMWHALALTEEGDVFGWGQDTMGAEIVPEGLGKVKAIGTGLQHSLAVREDGTVVGWGLNTKGACDPPADLTNVVAVSGGAWHSMALKADGTVVVWGGFEQELLAPPRGLSNVVAIGAGNFHNIALKSDGTVVAWGTDQGGAEKSPLNLDHVFAIAAGGYHNVAVSTQRTPFILWQPVGGKFSSGQTVLLKVRALGFGPFTYQWRKNDAPISGATGESLAFENSSAAVSGDYKVVISNAGGSVSSVTVHVDVVDSALFMLEGVVKSSVDFGATEPPAGLSDLRIVESSHTHALALRRDGRVFGWALRGGLTYGAENPPADLTDAIRIACGLGFSLALRSDGTVVSWGDLPGAPVPQGLSNVVEIAASQFFGFALKDDGTVVSFGDAPFIPLANDIKKIAAYDYSLIGLREDGTLTRWAPDEPAGVDLGLTNVVMFDAGTSNLVAVLRDGTVTGFAVPSGLTLVTGVSAGPKEQPMFDNGGVQLAYIMALKSNGTVASWRGGPDTRGLTNVTLIHAHNNYAMVQTLWPAIVRQPADQVLDVGFEAVIDVGVKGVGPFGFQWSRDGEALADQTNITLRIPSATPSHQGNYSVVVSNRNGSMASEAAELRIQAIQWVAQPTDEDSFVGGRVGFSAQVTGSKPISYQWRKGSVDIAGATNSFFGIESLQSGDAGNYSVVLTNPGGITNSRTASLRVFPTPIWKSHPPGTVIAFDGPAAPTDLTDVVAIAAGREYGLALRANGTVRQWGETAAMKYSPPPGLSNVVSIAAAEESYAAVLRNGTVVGWGAIGPYVSSNLYGVVEMSIGNQFAAIKVDGSWGFFPHLEAPTNATPAVAVELEGPLDGALMADGRVVTWGLSSIGSYIPDISDAVQIAGDGYSFMVLRRDGTVWARVFSPRHLPNIDLVDLTAISLGRPDYGLGLKRDGTVIGWGTARVPENLGPVIAIATGGFGVVLKKGASGPQLEIESALARQGVLRAKFLEPGFVLEASDRADGGFAPAANNIQLDQLFTLEKPQQYFRLRKPD